MPRTKNKDAANLWPAAGLTLIVFGLLIATGLVITFGVIQQLSYIAWERSLQQTEKSLAAEKELIRQTNDLKELLRQYQTAPLTVSETEIIELAKQRYSVITQSLPDNPDSVAEVLTDWSHYQKPEAINGFIETYQVETFTVIEQITQKQNWQLYVVTSNNRQSYDIFTDTPLSTNSKVTQSVYILENIAFSITKPATN